MKYEITGANRESGAEIKITVDATDFHHAEQQANDLGIMVSDVRESHEQPPVVHNPPTPTPTHAPATVAPHGLKCAACGSSPLVRRKIYRMSGPVVVIGYILLIPSILGILLNGLVLFAPIIGLASDPTDPNSASNQVFTEQLQRAGVNQVIINKVINHQPLTQDEKDSLTPQQNETVQSVEMTQAGAIAGACCAFGIWGGGALFMMVLCFVSGLLGWLLVMKKIVLQCVRCQAVVAAS